MKEFERKQIVTKEKYIELHDNLKNFNSKQVLQINYYYDNDELYLYNNNQTLRVRQIEDKLKLEYKYNKSDFNNLRICDEFTTYLISLPNVLKNPIKIEDMNTYKNIGVLITERTNYKLNDFIVSLDKNLYLGIIDYEIEIESNNLFDEHNIHDIINELGLSFKQQSVSKYIRFINQLKIQDKFYDI
ncbi:MAG TPA: hypothetical protein DCP51_05795 [Clostridiales bacterium]|nr:MAG: hypothetical protein A2Y40_00930 [Candidatus Margulisbacteria bacterium GWF2_35_9]HAN21173.1 hypothetical protein [Clostridiales bacterium]